MLPPVFYAATADGDRRSPCPNAVPRRIGYQEAPGLVCSPPHLAARLAEATHVASSAPGRPKASETAKRGSPRQH